MGRDSHAKHQPKQEKVFGPTLLAGLAAWGLITIAVSAHAQPALGGDLQWTAPPGCPDRSAVLHRIEQWLGHRLALEADASMVGHIERRGSAISLELRIEQGETAATRRLSGGTCEMLTDAVALMIAMAVDPDAVAARRRLGELALPAEGASPTDEVVESGAANGSRVPDAPPGVDGSATATEDSRAALEGEGEGEKEGGREKEGEGEDETEEEAGEEAGAPSRARSASTRELPRSPPALEAVSYSNDTLGAEGDTRGLRFVGSVGFAATFGALPTAAPGAAATVGVGTRWFEGSVSLRAFPRRTAILDDADLGGDIRLLVARLNLCATFELVRRRLEVLPCLSVEAGATHGRGRGIAIERAGSGPWLAAGAGIEARLWVVSWFGVGIAAELQVPLVRPPFVVTVDEERRLVHRAARVGATLGINLIFRVEQSP